MSQPEQTFIEGEWSEEQLLESCEIQRAVENRVISQKHFDLQTEIRARKKDISFDGNRNSVGRD
jgi:hypothetical protein